MKATVVVAAAAALAGGVSASEVHHRHAHAHDVFQGLQKKDYATNNGTCAPGCTTYYTTIYGEATLAKPTYPTTSTVVVVPTPIPQTCSTTGVYTFPATTVTLTKSTTVYAPSTTKVPTGTHTLGGVTTVVTTATTVTCPYATASTSKGVTTTVVSTTEYVCLSAGTYTIAPTTVTATKETTVTVPVITSYAPGTYTQPKVVTTVTKSNTVIYCPFDVPTTSSSAVETYPAATHSAKTTAVAYPTKPTDSLVSHGNGPWAISYTPYDNEGGCRTQSVIEADIAAIKAAGISAIRIYSTDCGTFKYVAPACEKNGVKLILGIYVDGPHCSANHPTISEQISDIKSWGNYDQVDLIIVANEAIFNGHCTASELSGLIQSVKKELSGYSGPYTTADVVSVWQQPEVSGALCDCVDYVGGNAHAYFNTGTVASEAGEFVKGQLDILNNICPGKPGKITETGWPSSGKTLGKAIAGKVEQGVAIASLVTSVGKEAVLFSYASDAWKSPDTECGCEQFFGCSDALGILGI